MSSLADIPYGLSRVHVESFEEHDAGPPHSDGIRPVGYGYRVGAALDEERAEVTVTIMLGVDLAPAGVEVDSLGPDTPGDRIANLVASSSFHLGDIEALRVDGQIQVPGRTLAMWIGIALSTARGILIGRARHPVFGEAPFPVLSPLELAAQLVATESPSWIASGDLPVL